MEKFKGELDNDAALDVFEILRRRNPYGSEQESHDFDENGLPQRKACHSPLPNGAPS